MRFRTMATIVLTAVAVSTAMAVSPVMSFPMEMNGEHEIAEAVSGKAYSVRGKHGCNIPAVVRGGLRTDGYSTYVQVPMADYSLNNRKMSVSLWTACQTYPMMIMDVAANKKGAIISCLDDTKKEGFAFFLYSQGTYGFECYVNGQKKMVYPSAHLPQYEWVHLCATVDADAGTLCLYMNGQQVASSSFDGTINIPTGNLFIGKSSVDTKADLFYLNTYNGIIDELNIYNDVLTEAEIIHLKSQIADGKSVDLNVPVWHYRDDLTRPRHHAMPASNWMNESHGMAYADGRFHVFFQKNGNGPYMSRLHWGHVSSPDLCNWTEERIAIVPGKSYDLKGCWSGCVFTDSALTAGEPWILYTGVDNSRATINLATPDGTDLVRWTKASVNPVINGTPAGYSADFRDPYFFRSGDEAYCIVGTSRDGVASTSLHRFNAEAGRFDYTGVPFFTGSSVAECGSFFEMPNVTPMGDGRWLFTATPLGTAKGVRTIYYVGHIEPDGTFATTQTDPKTVEFPDLAKDGYGLLSPTICQKDGKTIVLGIVPDKLATSINYNLGWAHTLSLPREWSLDEQGELVQKPYEGLQALRSATFVSEAEQTLNGQLPLAPVQGKEIEVEAVFTVAESDFGIRILENEDGKACKVYFSPSRNRFIVDCRSIGRRANDNATFSGFYSSELPGTVQAGDSMKIHLFFDHSVLDLFVNDRWATSIRIFPTGESANGVSLFADGDTPLRHAAAWKMVPLDETDPTEGVGQITGGQFPESGARKLIENNHVLIVRGGERYTLTGAKL